MPVVLPVKMSEMKDKDEAFFIELYAIKLRTGMTYIAACDEDIEYDGQKFIAIPFKRESLVRSMDNITDSCKITLGDVDYALLAYVMNGFDFRGCECTIFRIQYPDSLSDPTIFQWVFSGFIDEPAFAGGEFTCTVMSRFPQIDTPNRYYQLSCNSEFGDEECGMDLGTEKAKVIAADGNVLTLDRSFGDGVYRCGVCSVEGESRIINESSGNTVKLNVNFVQPMIGKEVTLNRGCDKTAGMCRKYGNMKQFSGFPAIPFESIYR